MFLMENKALLWYLPGNTGDRPAPFSYIMHVGNKWFSVVYYVTYE